MLSNAKRIDRTASKLPAIPKELVNRFLTGSMTGEAIDAALNAELSHQLGYEVGEEQPDGSTNHRNGSFEPVPIPKHARRFTGFDDKVIALYARGLTVREIRGFRLS